MTVTDEAFDAMVDSQRRQLLGRLSHDDPQPVPQLSKVSQELLEAHEPLLREYLAGSDEIADADKADIRTHHVHLPKLVEYNYIEWDQETHVTTKGPKFDDLKPLLQVVDADHGGRPVNRASLLPSRNNESRSRRSEFNAVSDH